MKSATSTLNPPAWLENAGAAWNVPFPNPRATTYRPPPLRNATSGMPSRLKSATRKNGEEPAAGGSPTACGPRAPSPRFGNTPTPPKKESTSVAASGMPSPLKSATATGPPVRWRPNDTAGAANVPGVSPRCMVSDPGRGPFWGTSVARTTSDTPSALKSPATAPTASVPLRCPPATPGPESPRYVRTSNVSLPVFSPTENVWTGRLWLYANSRSGRPSPFRSSGALSEYGPRPVASATW